MGTLQLGIGALAAAVIAAGCSRDDADERARIAAGEIRTAASRAGDRMADSWLTTKIQAQYLADEDVEARHLSVSTRDRVVTLAGRVGDENARQQAVQIAHTTDGVREVRDYLTVGLTDAEPEAVPTAGTAPREEPPVPGSGSMAVDAGEQIRDRIQAKYFLDSALKRRDIAVDVRGQVVTLHGEVAGEAERAQALQLARSTAGVERVEDNLTVDPALAP